MSTSAAPRFRYGPWRHPAVCTQDFPGLTVQDNRVTGSINIGDSRLPLWSLVSTACTQGWDAVEHSWEPSRYGWTAEKMAEFLYFLLEQRGELARLICVLADVERQEANWRGDTPWWQRKNPRARVMKALSRCMVALKDAGS